MLKTWMINKGGGVLEEIIRLCGILKPKYIVLENVANLLSRVEWIGYVLRRISQIGYDAEWQIIPASSVGAPHKRERVFILAYPTSERLQKEWEKHKLRETKTERLSLRKGWWSVEPKLDRVAYGIPNFMDRIKCLGNSLVPQIAEFIGNCIIIEEN